jgi:hypothetical protein
MWHCVFWYSGANVHGVTIQKTVIIMSGDVRTTLTHYLVMISSFIPGIRRTGNFEDPSFGMDVGDNKRYFECSFLSVVFALVTVLKTE